MSAPMNLRLPNKDAYNLLIRTNLVFNSLVLLLIYLPLNTKLPFDMINECIFATESLIILFLLFHIGVNALLLPKYSQHKPPAFKVKNIFKTCGVLILGSVGFHIIAVLFGAPFIESVTETFHFAMVMSATTVLPSLCVLGINFSLWIKVYAQNSPDIGTESILYCGSVGSVVGAWLGAIPIPLDWDRPWQVWPITCVIGCLVGYIVGVTSGVGHLYVQYQKSKKFKIT